MLTLEFSEMMFEIKDGSIKNIGPTNKSGTTKLFDVSDIEIREFGDKRIKLVFFDEDGNEVQIALFPSDAEIVRDGLSELIDGGTNFRPDL